MEPCEGEQEYSVISISHILVAEDLDSSILWEGMNRIRWLSFTLVFRTELTKFRKSSKNVRDWI
jgi:hypothetical protein